MGNRPAVGMKPLRSKEGIRIQSVLLLAALMLFAACVPERAAPPGGVQLVQDVTLAATTPAATRVLSPTPSPVVIPISTSELNSPLEIVTAESSFVLVTPTLPPSKTPTNTATQTSTATPTPRPTITPNLAISTPIPIPPINNNGIVPLPTPLGSNSGVSGCTIPWFFTQLVPTACALNPAVSGSGAFEQFQNGFMLWMGEQHAIYVLYDTANYPRWQVFNDIFQDGMPDTDPAYDNAPPNAWQPRRGFGLLWRSNPSLRDRIGWGVTQYETPYTIQIQTGSDGTIYMNEPRGGVFTLSPNSSDWKRYDS